MVLSVFQLSLQEDCSYSVDVTTCELDIYLDQYELNTNEGTPNITLLDSQQLIKCVKQNSPSCGSRGSLHFEPLTPTSTTFFQDDSGYGESDQFSAFNYWGDLLDTSLSVQFYKRIRLATDVNSTYYHGGYDVLSVGMMNDSNNDEAIWCNNAPEYVMSRMAGIDDKSHAGFS